MLFSLVVSAPEMLSAFIYLCVYEPETRGLFNYINTEQHFWFFGKLFVRLGHHLEIDVFFNNTAKFEN